MSETESTSSNTKSKFKIINWMNSNRTQIKNLIAMLMFFISVCLVIACISFLFTGAADQSLVENLDVNVTEELKAQIQNWMGYWGAKVSNMLVANGFGLGIFSMIAFIGAFGFYLFDMYKFNLLRGFATSVFLTIVISYFFSLINAENAYYNFGGLCGKMAISHIEAFIGTIGAVFLLLLFVSIFMLLVYGISIVELYGKLKTANLFSFSFINNRKGDTIQIQEKDSDEEIRNSEEEKNDDTPSDFESNQKDDEESTPSNTERDDAETTNLVETEDTQSSNNEIKEDDNFIINVAAETEQVDDSQSEEKTSETTTTNVDNNTLEVNPTIDMEPYDPTAELPHFAQPSLTLLNEYDNNATVLDEEEQINNQKNIKQVLKNFGIEITQITATVGPTITLYEIVPAPGVRISRIKSLEDDIALSLAANGIRIIAPIPGKGTIGIEVPNKKPQIVPMRSILSSKMFQETKMELPVAFGKTITNSVFMIDLAKAPHLLVAGATGQGKSVGLNALITSLIYKKHPALLKFVMVDPKQVEFSIYERISKHYLAKLPGENKAIITDTDKVVNTLKSLTTEMDNRYTLLSDVGLRNIKEYNERFISRRINPTKEVGNGLYHHFLPYIVVIIDEYGDLIMTAGKDIEMPIARIAQKARAVGIHMVIATQRPSVKIVTGTIKANFPARLAFRVASSVDSKTILDASGAQNLIGRGDMLYSSGGADMTRVQCAFVDTSEVEEVNKAIESQMGYEEPYKLPEVIGENGEIYGEPVVDTKNLDPLLRSAAEMVVNSNNGSTSSIQRSLEVGFNRAGRIMDQLEAIGVVGPVNGSKPRSVLIQDLNDLDIIFNNLGR